MSFKVFNNRLPRTFQFACLAAALLTGGVSQAASLTLYSAQHEQTVNLLVKDFEKQTGISVKVRTGEGPELAAQLLAEGSASPADVYFTSNSPELMLLEEKGVLEKVQPSTLSTIPARYNSPSGDWVGVVARENVLIYNTKLSKPGELPSSLLELADPAWKGKLAIAPADGDFLPLVSAVLAMKGEAATLQWLKGLRSNSQIFNDNEGVTAAVNRGAVATGIINNYYWARLHTELGDKGTHSALYHFANGDVGGLINVSGAAVLKTTHNQDASHQFLAYLTGESAQQLMAQSKVTYEYPLRAGVAPDPLLTPFSQLAPPALDMKTLGDDSHAVKLLRQAGLL